MSNSISILLAEDDINLGQLLQTFLKSKGFEVSLAQNGKIAFDKFNKDTFDFCIFDVMMPEMDGFTLAKEIREIDVPAGTERTIAVRVKPERGLTEVNTLTIETEWSIEVDEMGGWVLDLTLYKEPPT